MMRHYTHSKDDSRGRKVLKITGFATLGLVAGIFFVTVFGYFVMHLWNWLMPDIFSLAAITFWQAVGIILLARLIFGGFSHNRHNNGRCRDRHFTSRKFKEGKFSKWRYFEDFWEKEGKNAYNRYIENKKEPAKEDEPLTEE